MMKGLRTIRATGRLPLVGWQLLDLPGIVLAAVCLGVLWCWALPLAAEFGHWDSPPQAALSIGRIATATRVPVAILLVIALAADLASARRTRSRVEPYWSGWLVLALLVPSAVCVLLLSLH